MDDLPQRPSGQLVLYTIHVPMCGRPAIAINDCYGIIDCIGEPMASITIRNLDEALKRRLRIRAAQKGRSMEEEARDVLRIALAEEGRNPLNLLDAIRRRFAQVGPIDLPVMPREPMREPPDFGR